MPALPRETDAHFVPVEAEKRTQPAPQVKAREWAGRSVLKARGIQLPGAAPMRPMTAAKPPHLQLPCPVYPADCLIRQEIW